MSDKGFVSLQALRGADPSDPAGILAEIRTIYFRTTKKTIQNDFAHAIELLKRLPDEETRERATVYMDGLAQMRKEWFGRAERKATGQSGKRQPTGSRRAGKTRGNP